MHPSVSALISLMDPPPEGGDDCDWDDIARETAWRFPADYRDFTTVFGAGEIIGGVSVVTPPLRGKPAGSGILRDKPFPPADGLLMWGGDDVANDYHWRCTDPDPDLWTVTVRTRIGKWLEYDMGMADFLLKLLTRGLDTPFGLSMTSERYTFFGWRAQEQRMLEQFG